MHLTRVIVRWLWFPALAGFGYYLLLVWNPLPSDEEMIAHFRAHRADFEELVRRYREYPRPPDKDTSRWFKEGDTPALYERAGVRHISDSAFGPWLPDPYTLETARRVDHEIRVLKNHAIFHKHGALVFALTPAERYYAFSLRYVSIWKDYYFFPEIPQIRDGELLGPLQIVGKGAPLPHYREIDGVGTSQTHDRVFPSLNHLPSRWKAFECVYRQIEPQWFLRMCNGH